jgi:3-oxoacyl-[acyl-carrier-protein] synthase II
MHEECIPPTIGTQRLDPATRFDLVMERPRPHRYAAFQVNAFGFGGQNASLIFSR